MNDPANALAPVEGGLEIGVITLGEFLSDPRVGKKISAAQRLQEIVDAARLADEASLDVFGIGEHHSLDFVVSSVPVVLAAIAQATKCIRLTSAVTILSTADPVREFENFATLDLLSSGRAEMIAGRGAFIESFPLFGYDVADYDRLFPEKLDLLLKLNAGERDLAGAISLPSAQCRDCSTPIPRAAADLDRGGGDATKRGACWETWTADDGRDYWRRIGSIQALDGSVPQHGSPVEPRASTA
jgi:alkanesulfonate monooxygenase SsuD/methylene tetrahydromethanopterin reductase-like flavin-dependent oxidoreductase (luciferase family)